MFLVTGRLVTSQRMRLSDAVDTEYADDYPIKLKTYLHESFPAAVVNAGFHQNAG